MTQEQVDRIVHPIMDCVAALVAIGGIAATGFILYAIVFVAFAIDCGA